MRREIARSLPRARQVDGLWEVRLERKHRPTLRASAVELDNALCALRRRQVNDSED